jgi:hypothetical protein
MLTKSDRDLLSAKGIEPKTIENQIEMYKSGIKPVILDRPAIPNDGIEKPGEEGVLMYAGIYDKKNSSFTKVKFIPSSGAASRMFKDLFSALNTLSDQKTNKLEFISNNPEINSFFKNIEQFAFFNDLNNIAEEKGKNIRKLIEDEDYAQVLKLLLNPEGLNYGAKPKAVLKFHKYGNEILTPIEEHITEASTYMINEDNSLHLHFTVSPEHLELFEEITQKAKKDYAAKGIQLHIEFSIQEPSTDTLAVNMDNSPFREKQGDLHFRPGGHGALLKNLEKLNQDIIFIGNIDNVGTDRVKPLRILSKRFLGGYLLEKTNIIGQLLRNLESGFNMSVHDDIIRFVDNNISSLLAKQMAELRENDFIKLAFLTLNRPVRVCGMVKNTGEPGGGPFWVKSENGRISKQIIESSQIDLANSEQKDIFNSSTHFNPVDIACSIKNYKGEKFKLADFRDDNMAFIAKKSFEGKDLKALELPGLWNGAMAGWITFFLDVPIETFSPVKTVFDLVRPEHITDLVSG